MPLPYSTISIVALILTGSVGLADLWLALAHADLALHAVVGGLLCALILAFVAFQGLKLHAEAGLVLAALLFFTIGKEAYDVSQGGPFGLKDIFAGIAGAGTVFGIRSAFTIIQIKIGGITE